MTESGVLLNSHADDLLQRLAGIEREISDLREVIVGRLDLATVVIATEFVLPEAMGVFRSQYPVSGAQSSNFNSREVEEAVADGRDELGISLSHSPSDSLQIEKFGKDELALVVSMRHPLAGKMSVKPEELAGEAILVREPTSGTRQFIESRFFEAGVRLTYWLELNDNHVIKALVEANLGLAILSSRAVEAEVKGGRLSPAPGRS